MLLELLCCALLSEQSDADTEREQLQALLGDAMQELPGPMQELPHEEIALGEDADEEPTS